MKMRKEGAMSNDAKMAVLETTMGHIYETLERMDKRFDSIDYKFEKIDQRFDKIDQRFEKIDEKFEKTNNKIDDVRKEMAVGLRDLNNRLWFNFIWVVGGFVGVLTLIARLFHWL